MRPQDRTVPPNVLRETRDSSRQTATPAFTAGRAGGHTPANGVAGGALLRLARRGS
jgi:hypothetical protein